ncbi:MAG: glycosyltransferase family 4 protein [bacterium]|nr:glycosyltransferase family 4 protein [bacterium]
MRKLRIGQISPLNLPVPPQKYGGTERIIYFLCRELTKRGHEVFLFGTGDSKVDCHLLPILKKGLWGKKVKESAPYYAYEMALVAKKSKELKLDILHDHLGPWALTLYGQTEIPIIHTLHVPFKNKDRIWAYKKLKAKLVSISFAQRKPAKDLNYAANIYNGIDVNSFPFNLKPKNYFCWVGELSPRKGIYEVIKIAETTKINLVLAGRIPPPQQEKDYFFFKKHIEKKLNQGNIKYVGEINEEKLKNVYKNAIAFLYPLQWEEPFGLTVIESMACGTPVIAFKGGSMEEIINDKKTGFVIPAERKKEVNYEGFIKAMEKIDQIDRKECRKWVEGRFTIERMVSDYEKLYYRILEKQS